MKIGILEQISSVGGGGPGPGPDPGPDGYAELSDFTDSIDSSGGSTRQFRCPNNIAAGDIILAFFSGQAQQAALDSPPPAGWVLGNPYFAYKVALGNEDGSMVSFNLFDSSSLRMICTMCRAAPAALTPKVSSVAEASDTTIDPSSFSPSFGAGNNLWISALWSYGSSNTLISRPSGYSLYPHAYVGVDNSGWIQLVAKRSTLATENPGPWTMDRSDSLRTMTVAVR